MWPVKIRCSICKVDIQNKTSVAKRHLESAEHKQTLETVEQEIRNACGGLVRYGFTPLPVEPNFGPEPNRAMRLALLRCFLIAGIPLVKVPNFRRNECSGIIHLDKCFL